MKDTACVEFLQWALPRLGKRWPGFRKVRRQVCKRIDRRLAALDLAGVTVYRTYLEAHPAEWATLDTMCRISISRFYRDRGVFDCLRTEVGPALARAASGRGEKELHIWSLGCASGEEPYTLSLAWHLDWQARCPEMVCRFIATEADPHLLDRARRGCYSDSSLKDLPAAWRQAAFEPVDEHHCLREEFKTGVEFRQQDIRTDAPSERFHLILCRNLVFTYFDMEGQQQVLARLIRRLRPGGALVTGKTEQLPPGASGFRPWFPKLGIYRKRVEST